MSSGLFDATHESGRIAWFRRRVRAYRLAFEGAKLPPPFWARLLARLGLARLAAFFLSDGFWLSIVLADLERFCHARSDQTVYVSEDPHGRDSAALEARRQVFLRIASMIRLTPIEQERLAGVLREEEEDEQRFAS